MPSRVEDYEELFTIGSGSYGRCQKVRRKSDGKVSKGNSSVLIGQRPLKLLPNNNKKKNGIFMQILNAGNL